MPRRNDIHRILIVGSGPIITAFNDFITPMDKAPSRQGGASATGRKK